MSTGSQLFSTAGKLEAYLAFRHRPESLNESIEKPIILEMLGDVQGQHVLDLGCGDGVFGANLLQAGCKSYTGIEISKNMLAVASQTVQHPASQLILSRIEDWEYPANQFDLVTSRLALHYIADLSAIFAKVKYTLTTKGRFIFSIVHPIITASDKSRANDGLRQDWIVDNYFARGTRQVFMRGEYLEQYHRTIEDIFQTLQNTGFVVEQLREACPKAENFTDSALFERRKRIPLFLFFAAS